MKYTCLTDNSSLTKKVAVISMTFDELETLNSALQIMQKLVPRTKDTSKLNDHMRNMRKEARKAMRALAINDQTLENNLPKQMKLMLDDQEQKSC